MVDGDGGTRPRALGQSVREGAVRLGDSFRLVPAAQPTLQQGRSTDYSDVSLGTQNAVAGSPERPGVKYPLGVSQHPPSTTQSSPGPCRGTG